MTQITIALTKRITNGVRPNCEANWAAKWPRPLAFDWNTVWKSLGTPLSDPTEERAWRNGTRDYWRVVTKSGDRLWLYFAHGGAISGGWFCHGRFA